MHLRNQERHIRLGVWVEGVDGMGALEHFGAFNFEIAIEEASIAIEHITTAGDELFDHVSQHSLLIQLARQLEAFVETC